MILLRQLRLVIPPPELPARFDELAGGWMKQIAANLHQPRTLAALRDTLLPKLLSGELSVANAEGVVHNPGRQSV